MELGNLAFGHSRGEYPVDRGLQTTFHEWLDVMGFGSYGNKKDSDEWAFENDTFRMQPYYWGDCQCGFEDAEMNWYAENDHAPDCYQVALHHAIGDSPYGQERDAKIKRVCAEYRLPYPSGCMVHCTCDYNERFGAFLGEHSHADDCPTITPNFHHKPTGLQIMWYKYPFRDSYSNQPLDKARLHGIMQDCANSMGVCDQYRRENAP